MEIPQDSRHRVGFLDFLDVLDSLVFLDFLDFYIHNVLIENIHVKHSIFVSARIYIYIFMIPPLKLNLVQKSEVTVHPLKFIKSIANTNKIN